MKNYYKILQVDPAAEKEVIEVAYRRLLKKYHPDVAIQNEQTFVDNTEKIRDIIEAYETLSEDESRRKYDDAYKNYIAEVNRRKFDQTDPHDIFKTVLMKCSVSTQTYKMYIAKKANWDGPYIVQGFELVDQETATSAAKNNPWSLQGIVDKVRGTGKNELAVISKDDGDHDAIGLGDIEWIGVRCPDCAAAIEIKPGIYSLFSVCARCHQMMCIGNGIKGLAGYHIQCPWCNKKNLIMKTIKTGSKSGLKITGVNPAEKTQQMAKLPDKNKLLGKK